MPSTDPTPVSRPVDGSVGSYLGTPLRRREDADLLSGRARTVADLRPGDVLEQQSATGSDPVPTARRVLEAAFVRSPVAHGVLRGVDVGAARAVPGVVGAWAAADLPELPTTPVPPSSRGQYAGLDWPALATDRVRYVGEPVAVVLAGSRAEAEDGARAVTVDVDRLAAVLDPREAARPDAPQLFPGRSNVVTEVEYGEVPESVFRTAPVVVTGAFRQPRVLPSSLEPRAMLAAPAHPGRPDAGLVVWCSHQAQHNLRSALATVLFLADDAVRVIVPATGGAFGAKSQVFPEYVTVAYLARLLDRPVRWVEDRAEAMVAATRGRGQWQRTRLAADEDGRFLAYELEVDADVGAYPHTGAGVPEFTARMSTGAYATPAVRARVRCVLTNTPPTSAYRGAGRPEAAYAIERTVDLLARELGVDPVELRRRNHIRPDQFPYTTPTGRTYDSGAYTRALDRALEAVDAAGVRTQQERRRRDGGRPIGLGVATYVERSGGPPDSDEHGSVEACADGSVVARVGSTSTGQGHRTVFAQLVATALGVPVDVVRVLQNDTAAVPYGFGTFGSRSVQVGGTALWQACSALAELAGRRVAAWHGVPADGIRYAGGRLHWAGGSATLAQVAAREPGGSLRADRRPAVPQAFPFGAYAAVVEVDPDLGSVEVVRLVAVDDYGVVVNPLLVDGQGYGSVAQGLGQALFEEAVTGPDGVPAARSLLDYLLPTAADLPEPVLLETCTPNPNVPFGSKGAGEAGCIGAPPAVVNAVCDALGLRHVDLPLTPEAVWTALRAADRP